MADLSVNIGELQMKNPVMTNFCSFMLVPLLTEIYAKACPIVIRQIYNMRYLIAL